MGRVMFFLLRMAFWLGVVCVLLPNGNTAPSPQANIDATQAVTLASAAVSDMRGFCDRQPDACAVGGKVALLDLPSSPGAKLASELGANALFGGLEEELARLERLIATLQGLHKRVLHPMELNRTEISLGRVIRACVANYEPVATQMGITLSADIPAHLPPIRADEDRIIQVLTNLLDNAFKFTPRGGSVVVQAGEEAVQRNIGRLIAGLGRPELQAVAGHVC